MKPARPDDRCAWQTQIVITRHGKPAGVLIGFETEDDWFDYCLENDPRFLDRIESARSRRASPKGASFRVTRTSLRSR